MNNLTFFKLLPILVFTAGPFLFAKKGKNESPTDGQVYVYYQTKPKNLQEEGMHQSGMKTGLWKFYYQTGKLRSEGQYKISGGESQRTGLWKEYSEDGNLSGIENYENGQKIGNVIRFHPNGQTNTCIAYGPDGNKEGPAVQYYSSGTLLKKGQFKANKRDGVWVEYHGNNTAIFKKITYSADKIEGPYEEYSDKGQKISEGVYKNEKTHGKWKYYAEGTISSEVSYESGITNGLCVFYAADGSKERVSEIVSNVFHGKETEYYPDGKIKAEGMNEKGIKSGIWSFFDKSGHLKEKGPFKFGKKNGDFETYHANGKVESRGPYAAGSKKGSFSYFDANSLPVKIITYSGASLRGPVVLFINGKKSKEFEVSGIFSEDELFNKDGSLKEDSIKGAYKEYYSDGQTVKVEGFYSMMGKDKIWKYFDEKGQETKSEQYKMGDIVK